MKKPNFSLKYNFRVQIESKQNPESLKKTRPCIIKNKVNFVSGEWLGIVGNGGECVYIDLLGEG